MYVRFEVQVIMKSQRTGMGKIWGQLYKSPAPFRHLRAVGTKYRGFVTAVVVVDDEIAKKRRPLQNEIRWLLAQKLTEFTSVPVKSIGFKQLDLGVI